MERPKFSPRERAITASERRGQVLGRPWLQLAAFVLANAISLGAVGGGDGHVAIGSAPSVQPAASPVATAPSPVIDTPIGAGWG